MKLNYKRTVFIGLAFLSISSFWQLYDNIIPLILKNTFGIGETLTGAIMAIDNVLALVMLPFFGALSDKVDTRLGKRTPFIISGTFMAVISMAFLPLADSLKSLPMFFIALGIVLMAMSTYRSPAVALMPDLTPKPLRSKANAVINLMGALGGLFALIAIRFLTVEIGLDKNYTWVFMSVALLMVVTVAILVKTINEKKLSRDLADELAEDEEGLPAATADIKTKDGQTASKKKRKLPKDVFKSLSFLLASVFLWFAAYNAITTAFSRYAQEVWDLGTGFTSPLMVAIIAATLSFIPIGLISSKIGRKRTIIAGICLMTFSYFIGIWFINYSSWLNVVFILIG
ncbi:MAG TPA: MFS transporter, partial [Bacillota bacterium]|nr:MFS transporter [Bacillota bacterium]